MFLRKLAWASLNIVLVFLTYSFLNSPHVSFAAQDTCDTNQVCFVPPDESGGGTGGEVGGSSQWGDVLPGAKCGTGKFASGYIYVGGNDNVYGNDNGVKACSDGSNYLSANGLCCQQGTPAPTLPPHDGYDLGGDCNANSICYTGPRSGGSLTAGAQCGNLRDWHYGMKKAGDPTSGVPSCSNVAGLDGAVCCDPGPASVTPIPPNICPSQNGVCKNVDTALGNIDVNGISPFISRVFSILLSISGGIAILLIAISGYRIITAQGDPEKLKGAREMLTSAIVGLLFIIFSVTILTVIGFNILRIPGFQ